MKKTLILLTALTLFSCGSLKKEKESTTSESNKDSQTETKTDSTSKTTEKGSKSTIIDYKADSFIYKPFDANTPFFVDGKEYKGVIVESKKETSNTNVNEQWEKIVETLLSKLEKTEERLKQLEETNKVHKEKDNTMLFLGIAGIIGLVFMVIVFVVLWWISKNLKPSL